MSTPAVDTDITPFAFYGRVSTEDQQDPEASRAWQLSRARVLVEPRGGSITHEFFDIGLSRSLPWKRRPQATQLLAALRDPNRGFDAVVIGEPQRAFYGNQYGLTFPVFAHYGVGLWVPEVGGPIDPESEAHDLVMSVFGGMSKGERTRIKIRVRAAMASQTVMEGRFLGGRPPYGYRMVDLGPHPNPAKAATGQRLHGLGPDETTGPIVVRIFSEYVSGKGIYAIAEGLTRDRVPSPSAYDPGRNRHRSGTAWSKSAIRAILANPRYTGYQVWNRQRKDEVLIDVDDVALGHETRQRWNHETDWLRSSDPSHQAIITPDLFDAAQAIRSARTNGKPRKARSTLHHYLLRGVLYCGLCHRKMQGNWNHDMAYYRCRFPNEYGLANHVEHPRTVYLREADVIPALDQWLLRLFQPDNLDHTLDQLVAAQPDDHAEADVDKRLLAECDRKLDRYRAALEAGTDPAVVNEWISQVQAERAATAARIRATRQPVPMSREQIRSIVSTLTDLATMIENADPRDRAEIYQGLGVRLTYHPGRSAVLAEANPANSPVCVRYVSKGGLDHAFVAPMRMAGVHVKTVARFNVCRPRLAVCVATRTPDARTVAPHRFERFVRWPNRRARLM